MTNHWHTADLDRFGAADEVDIATVGPDGMLRRWVPIWIVRLGDDLYIRSYRGPAGAWYRHLSATGHGYVAAMTSDTARATTLRLAPR
jgi:hypothetical protein